MARPQPKVPFDDWLAVSRPVAGDLARDDRLPTEMRMERAAWERVQPSFHAHFQPGELVSIIDKDPSTVHRALARLKAWGLVYDGSSLRCIQVASNVAAKGGAGARSCAYCDAEDRKARRKRHAEQDTELPDAA